MGVGDPYFPLEGNGGYDALHYDLTLGYDPASDRLDGVATITARAEQGLSSFDLDLQQLDVKWVAVNGRRADFSRDGQELTIAPRKKLHKRSRFVVSVGYGGVPVTIVGSPIVFGSPYGFLHTDDGQFVGAEPNAASTWFPSNDHPSDKATYVFRITVPEGITAVANGRLAWSRTRHGKSTFVWYEDSPMATYLATVDSGVWQMKTGRTPGGVPETVVVDPALVARAPTPSTTSSTPAPRPSTSRASTSGLPVQLDRGDRRQRDLQRPAARVLARDPDQAGLLGHPQRHDDRARAVAPVVRRQRLGGELGQIWLNEGFATFAETCGRSTARGRRTSRCSRDSNLGRRVRRSGT